MNAKTISTLTFINVSISILLLAAIVICAYRISGYNDYLSMRCMSTIHINDDDTNKTTNNVSGDIRIIFHTNDDGQIAINEYGTLKYLGHEYLVDRTSHMVMAKKTQNGFHKVTRGAFITNRQDNVPLALSEKLTSSQKILFYKIQKIEEKTWRISDLQRTIFICYQQ